MRVHILRFHLYKLPENPNSSVVTESKSVAAWEQDKQKEALPKGTKKLWRNAGIFTISTVVMVSQVYTFVKLTKPHTLDMCSLLYANYT